jgi:hypothetical protein
MHIATGTLECKKKTAIYSPRLNKLNIHDRIIARDPKEHALPYESMCR